MHITAKTATAAALTTSRLAATKPTPPKQNAPTAVPLNTEADKKPPKGGFTYHLSKIRLAKEMSLFVMQRKNLKRKK